MLASEQANALAAKNTEFHSNLIATENLSILLRTKENEVERNVRDIAQLNQVSNSSLFFNYIEILNFYTAKTLIGFSKRDWLVKLFGKLTGDIGAIATRDKRQEPHFGRG